MARRLTPHILVAVGASIILASPAHASWPGPEQAQAALNARDWSAELALCDDDPTCARVLEDRATLHFAVGDHAAAVTDLVRALELDSSPDRHLRMGLSLVPLGRDREAEAHLTVGLVLPGASPALVDRARIMLGVLNLDADAEPLQPGQPFPNLALLGQEGDRALGQLEGPLVVDLWSVSCAPCIAAMPRLQQASERWATGGVGLIGINVDRRKEQYERFLRKRPVGYDTAWAGSTATEQTGTVGLPTVFVLDEQHRVFARFTGDFGPDDTRVDLAVQALIAARAPSQQSAEAQPEAGRDANGD